MELSVFAAIIQNLNSEDDETRISCNAEFNQFLDASPGEAVSNLFSILLESESMLLPLILLKQAASNQNVYSSIGFDGFWYQLFPRIHLILSKITNEEELNNFCLFCAYISKINSESMNEVVLPLLFEMIADESQFVFAISTLTSLLLLTDKDTYFLQFEPFFLQATAESRSENELLFRLKLFFSMIHHFSSIDAVNEYFQVIPTLIPETLVVEYLNQLQELFERFPSYFSLNLAGIFNYIINLSKSDSEEVATKSMVFLSSVSRYVPKEEPSFQFIQTFVEGIARVSDDIEWNEDEDFQSFSFTCRNLFNDSAQHFRTVFLLDTLTSLKGSADSNTWQYIYALLAAFSEINWSMLKFMSNMEEKLTTIVSSLCTFCELGNPEQHPRLKCASLDCLIN